MTDDAYQPLILIGAARSGTKFLRDLFGQMPGFFAVPYDINYVWRSGNEELEHDELDPSMLDERRKARIRSSIASLARPAGRSPVIVEKTVSNTLRVPFVDAVFPQARYLHLVRDGRAVVESSARMWKAPPDVGGLMQKLRALPPGQFGYVWWFARNYLKGALKGRSGGEVWGPRYRGILHDQANCDLITVVARQWARCVEKASADLAAIPAERVFTIRYEDLIGNPDQIVAAGRFAGVADADLLRRTYEERIERANLDKWRARLKADEIVRIEQEASQALRMYDYE